MKKNLCWLLALAILFTCLTASVSAVRFTDYDSIGMPYRETVERMTTLGVLNGFPDGSFQPKGTLTREQGAKIIAYMCLGPDAEGLSCNSAPFDDVEADRWSAPPIAWCAEHDILLGYGDGTFGPEDKLTGDQFAKMLLCAFELGDTARFAGPGWSDAVRLDADGLSLYKGDGTMASDLPISREQAALLAWNTIQAAQRMSAEAPDSASVPGKVGETEAPGTTDNTGSNGNGRNISLSWLDYLFRMIPTGDPTIPNPKPEPEPPQLSTGDDITLPDLP